jgi:MYXO-CTERM domain-containing protein
MSQLYRRSLGALGLVALVSCTGLSCAMPVGTEDTRASAEAIVNGTPASAYPEAALVDMYSQGQLGAYCSGAVIAPRVVLTAGHCVKGVSSATQGTFIPDSWKVTTPYNGNQHASSSGSEVLDWVTNDGTVDPAKHDVGLIFLATPIQIAPSQCPALATKPLADNSMVVNIGRIQNMNLSTSQLFVGAPISVVDGASINFPFDYDSQQPIIQEGDSGGPDEVPGTTPHLIVAVNSGGGPSDEVLAKIDLVESWIRQQIQAHGGPCTESPVLDAGGAEGGPAPVDAGPAPIEAGARADAAPDSFTVDSQPAGCSCRTAPSDRRRGALALVGLAALALARRLSRRPG